MPEIAQTWPQLVQQLSGTDLQPSELSQVRRGFDQARVLFAGAERPDGRPFLDHLVGTASGTLLAGAPTDTVVAALVHAAYDEGDFGDTRPGAHERHRHDLRAAIGREAEALVHRYHTLGWSPETARRCRTDLDALPPLDRQVLVVRVANEVDDGLSGALHISGKLDHRTHTDETHDDLMAIAASLTAPAFVAVARDALRRDGPPPPAVLVVGRGRSGVQLPASARWSVRRRAHGAARHVRKRGVGLAHRVHRRLTGPRRP